MRPRNPSNRALPPNLYRNGRYYQYKHPLTKQYFGMGTDRQAAIRAAHQLNAKLIEPVDLTDRILAPPLALSAWLVDYRTMIDDRGYAPETLRQRHWAINVIDQALGTRPLAAITTREIAEFLDTKPPRMSNVFRTLLSDIMGSAIAKGHLVTNPVAVTKNRRVKITRTRLEFDEFQTILAAAKEPFATAFELALVTLQRREDIAALKFTQIEGDTLKVIQQKRQARVAIKITEALARALKKCNTGIETPWIIHHQTRSHYHQPGDPVNAEALTRAFKKTRDACGVQQDRPIAERASFHEIRSLGARLYEAKGIDPQGLLGHKSRTMTEVYLDTRRNEWIAANPDTDLFA